MADTYETKKINELSEVTSADDSDLMMVGNPSTGETDKITKENFLKEINEDLAKLEDIAANRVVIPAGELSGTTEIPAAYEERVVYFFNNILETNGRAFSYVIDSNSSIGIAVIGIKHNANMGKFLCIRNTNTEIYSIRISNGQVVSTLKLVYDDDLAQINTSLSNLESDVTEINSALTELSTYKKILSIQTKTVTCDYIGASQTATGTNTITRVSDSSNIYTCIRTFGWLSIGSVSVSGTTVTVTFLNASGESHSGTVGLLLIEVE